ncbi:MAG: hypothetical protein QNJ54_36855 [Prochloraceae cyanobacterium]|nr:hypothetical protein [Prochloraceae cyanobacterium]
MLSENQPLLINNALSFKDSINSLEFQEIWQQLDWEINQLFSTTDTPETLTNEINLKDNLEKDGVKKNPAVSNCLEDVTDSIVDNYLATEIEKFYPLLLSNHTESMLLALPAQLRNYRLQNPHQLPSKTTPIELNTARHFLMLIREIAYFLHQRPPQPQEKQWIAQLYKYFTLFKTFLLDYQQNTLSDRLVFQTLEALKILSLEIQLSQS